VTLTTGLGFLFVAAGKTTLFQDNSLRVRGRSSKCPEFPECRQCVLAISGAFVHQSPDRRVLDKILSALFLRLFGKGLFLGSPRMGAWGVEKIAWKFY
jgi:hypothetical protein